MPKSVRQSIKIGAQEANEAIQPLLESDGSREFFESAEHVLQKSSNYSRLLDDARLVGFDTTAVNAGFIAGLKAASEFFNLNYEFLIEA